MPKENGFASRHPHRVSKLETAMQQIHREQRERKQKRIMRQHRKMQLIARRNGIRIEQEMKSASILKRIRWWFIKLWRKLTG